MTPKWLFACNYKFLLLTAEILMDFYPCEILHVLCRNKLLNTSHISHQNVQFEHVLILYQRGFVLIRC